MSNRGEWVRRLAACALLVAGCGPGSQGEEVAGSTPAEGDIADPRRMNTWQAGTPDGTIDNTSHSECNAGDCVDILLQRGLYFCEDSIDADDFEVVLRSQPLPSTVVRSIHFGGARGTVVPSAWNSSVGSACGTLQAGELLPDTVTVRIDTSALTDEVERSNLRIQVRAPTSANPMFVVPVTVDPSNGSTTVGQPRQLRAQQTLATFSLSRESEDGEPVLEDNSFLDTDLVRPGPCLPGIGSCNGDTTYVAPHGELMVRLVSNDGLGPGGDGMILGAYMQYQGDLYVGPFNTGAASPSVFEEVPFAIHFQTQEDGGGAIRLAPRTVCTNDVCATPEYLPLAEHVPLFEVTHDGTLFRVGDPERLLVGRSTQSATGVSFRPGTDGQPVSFTVAPVAFDEPFYGVASGNIVTFSGVVANPNITRVEIGYAAESTIGEATVASNGTFSISSQFTFDWGADRFIEVRAYWGSEFVGHDRVPFELLGPREDDDADGVPDSSDNCVGVYNPNQLDLNPATTAGFGCESDSDGDGLSDASEDGSHTSALLRDTDSDGLDDGTEGTERGLGQGLSGVSPDTDGDGILDSQEVMDANGDGISDALDPNNATIGVDPASGLFLLREEWNNEFTMSVPGSGQYGEGEYLVEAKVSFKLNYLLAESSTANWLSTDVLGSPLTRTHDLALLRMARADSIGLPYITDIVVETVKCRHSRNSDALATEDCAFVPAMRVLTDMEIEEVLRPRQVGLVRGENDQFTLDEYPRGGFTLADVQPQPGNSTVVYGMEAIDPRFRAMAYYGGLDSSGRTHANEGEFLNFESLSGEFAPESPAEGLSLFLCERPPADENGVRLLPTEGPTACHKVGDGTLGEYGIRLSEFNDFRVGSGMADPADYSLCGSTLFGLLRERGEAFADATIEASSSIVGSVPGACVNGTTREVQFRSGSNVLANAAGLPSATFKRSISATILALGIHFIDPDTRSPQDVFAATSPNGTDTVLFGRHIMRARAARAETSNSAAWNDWFRVNVGLPRTTDARSRAAMDELFRRCDMRSDRCPVHLHVQLRNVTQAPGSLVDRQYVPSGEGNLISQTVQLRQLRADGTHRGARLRWTGQYATAQTLNTLGVPGANAPGTSANVVGCGRISLQSASRSSQNATPVINRSEALVHPGAYQLRGRLSRSGSSLTGVDCSSSTAIGTAPPALDEARLQSHRVVVGLSVPVSEDFVENWFISAYRGVSPGVSNAEGAIALHEMRSQIVSALPGLAVDVFSVERSLSFGAPFPVVEVRLSGPADACTATAPAGFDALGKTTRESMRGPRPLHALSCVDLPAAFGSLAIEFTGGLCGDRSREGSTTGFDSCTYSWGTVVPPLDRAGASAARRIGAGFAVVAIHELGHGLGLMHSQPLPSVTYTRCRDPMTVTGPCPSGFGGPTGDPEGARTGYIMYGSTVEPADSLASTCTGISRPGATWMERLYAADLMIENVPAFAFFLEPLQGTTRGGRVSNSSSGTCLGVILDSPPYVRASPLAFLVNQYPLR